MILSVINFGTKYAYYDIRDHVSRSKQLRELNWKIFLWKRYQLSLLGAGMTSIGKNELLLTYENQVSNHIPIKMPL